MAFDGTEGVNRTSVTGLAVALPRAHRSIVKDRAKPTVSVVSTAVECTVRAARARPTVAPQCKYGVIRAPRLEDFYPAAARQLEEQGPVDVAFMLDLAEGKPSDVRVVGSSLSERLDKAAVQYIENARFSTPCPFKL
jgi:TonB family protein